MTFSIIQKSQLEGAQRIDAEYYQPEYLKLDQILKSQENLSLGHNLDFLTDGAHQTPDYQQSGVLFLSSGLIHENYINFAGANFISDNLDRQLKHCKPKVGDVLVSKSGKIGSSVVYDENVNCNLFEGVALLRPKKNINPYYLSVFLNSRLGQKQIKRLIIGISQPHLHLEQVKHVRLPLVSHLNQERIEKIYLESRKLLKESDSLLKQAEDLLLGELTLKDFDRRNDLFSIVEYGDIVAANRNDAEYFQPKYLRLKEKLSAISKPLLNLVQNVPAEFEPTEEPEKEFKYVELANINSANGFIDGYETILGKEAPSRARRILKAGDVIVSSVEGSLNKVALVTKAQEGHLASTGFFQFRSSKIAPEVLLIVMKSIVMQWQLKQHCVGTILTAAPTESLDKMYIPILPKSITEQIVNFVVESHAARQKSKELLEEAKSKVEEMIEKGGE